MYDLEDSIFEHNDMLYQKVIDIYVALLSIKVIDVVDRVTNIKQDINAVVIQEIILEKVTYYVSTLRYSLSELYIIFGVKISPEASLSSFTLMPKLIVDLENADRDRLVFLEYLPNMEGTIEDKFLKLLDELYPAENNMSHIEDIDVSEYFFTNVVMPIYNNKLELGNDINLEMVNILTKLIIVDNNVKDTLIYQSVLKGETFVPLDMSVDTNLIVETLVTSIKSLKIDETLSDRVMLEIATTLYLFKGNTDLMYFINTDKLDAVFKLFDKPLDIKHELIFKLSKMEG